MTISKAQLARLRSLRSLASEAQKRLTSYIQRLALSCDHPESEVTEVERDYDNGYGRWWKRKHKHCKICLAENHWGKWSGPSPRTSGEFSDD